MRGEPQSCCVERNVLRAAIVVPAAAPANRRPPRQALLLLATVISDISFLISPNST